MSKIIIILAAVSPLMVLLQPLLPYMMGQQHSTSSTTTTYHLSENAFRYERSLPQAELGRMRLLKGGPRKEEWEQIKQGWKETKRARVRARGQGHAQDFVVSHAFGAGTPAKRGVHGPGHSTPQTVRAHSHRA